MTKTIVINTKQIAEDMEDFKPGEQLIITLTVDSIAGNTISGTADEIEYGEPALEPEPVAPEPSATMMGRGAKMPARPLRRAMGMA